ncbi:nesprin-1-like [Syngnathus typhle]|uniref:nesprin-1-like n=1 Tax=Syngnathus typhle TaxID=161592 RepID=UPI002A6B3CDD|nr:nesprin-1-like [Syngnathus typhle]
MASPRHYRDAPHDIANVMQRLQDEQESVQKRTFTKWINSHLAKRIPPLVVTDLFEDIKDGVKLLALLEVLSGQKLPCEQGRKLKRIHWVANIGTALNFLQGRKIKLVNINSTDIVDGRPSIVLGLVWTIILYFQIEELTCSLPLIQAPSDSSSSLNGSASGSENTSPPVKKKPLPPVHGGVRKALLRWVQQTATKRLGIEVKDFGPSWRSGLAFLAIIHTLRPNLVDMEHSRRHSNRENLREAFLLAETQLGIAQLLDPEDVDVDKPDEKSIMTYVAQFLKRHPDGEHGASEGPAADEDEEASIPQHGRVAPRDIEEMLEREQRKSLREFKMWLEQLEKDALHAQETEANLALRYQLFKSLGVQLEMRRKHMEDSLKSTQKDGMLTVDQALVKQAWERISNRLLDWHLVLDTSLPAPLDALGAWLHHTEGALRQNVEISDGAAVGKALERREEVLKSLEGHQQVFQRIHKDRSIDGISVPPEQLQDMAERLNFISTSCNIQLAQMEFLKHKHSMEAFLTQAESKLKSWIVKYGRQESVEQMLRDYVVFVEKQYFFESYKTLYQSLKRAAEVYISADSSADEGETGVSRHVWDVAAQWRSLSMEVRSVRSMLEEVLSNWDRYVSTVASFQAWLEDAEGALRQPENTKQEFFKNHSHWMDQHAAMNDAGNFLIETCDETVSFELKQQLLLLNGRWRELFLKVKQHDQVDRLEKGRKDHLKAMSTLTELLDTAEARLSAPVQVSFLGVRAFLQDVENTKQKLVTMETQYKLAGRSAQLLAKDAPHDESAGVIATITTAKSRLSLVRERCPALVKECHALLPLLEEMEKQMSVFYQALERARRISAADPHTPSPTLLGHKWQDFLNQQQSCKRCLAVIERNHNTVQRALSNSKVLQNFETGLLQKKLAEVQGSAQEIAEWRRREEANNCLRRRFEESRQDLEAVLKRAQDCLGESGDAEELLKKHTDVFSQLDQHVLSVFLKACDELTDILPEEEQRGLQETVRRLHKHWKDIQGEVPSHLLRLKVEVEQYPIDVVLQECRSELDRELHILSGSSSSDHVIQEHRMFFRERKPLAVCEKRIRNMEDLCQKLPDNDAAYRRLDATRRAVEDVAERIRSTGVTLEQHPDKWKEWNDRFCELSDWLSSQRRHLKETARTSSHQEEVDAAARALREAGDAREESLLWLKSRLLSLSDVSSEVETQRQQSALNKLSADFKELLSTLCQECGEGSGAFPLEELREEVRGALEEVLRAGKETGEQINRILDAEDLREAQELFFIHQQHSKQLQALRREADLLVSHSKQIHLGEALSRSVHELEERVREADCQFSARERSLQATLSSWRNFEREWETLQVSISDITIDLHKEFIFNNLDSLRSELDHTKELFIKLEDCSLRADVLLEEAVDLQLGPKNQIAVLHQAQSSREAVEQIEDHLKKNVVHLERTCSSWERFNEQSVTFSTWINEKQRALDAIGLNSPSDYLDEHIGIVEVVAEGLEARRSSLLHMEKDYEALSRFITPGESGCLRERVTQMRRSWQELMEKTKQLTGQLNQSASYRQRCSDNLEQFEKTMNDLKEKLDTPVTLCSSSSQAFKNLQSHMEVCRSVEQLKPGLIALCTAVEGTKLEHEVLLLQQLRGELLGKASEKQSALESFLTLWKRFEKEYLSMKSWLGACEFACRPADELLCVDKVKLTMELQHIQEMRTETPSNDALLEGLLNIVSCLYPSAPEARVGELNDELTQLQERYASLKSKMSRRHEQLERQLLQLELFNDALLTLSQKSQHLPSVLRSSLQVDVTDLDGAFTELKEQDSQLKAYSSLRKALQQRESALLPCSSPEAQQKLQAWREDCLQPFTESEHLQFLRKKCLNELKTYLEKREAAVGGVGRLREAVVRKGSWDPSETDELHREVTRDVARLEAEAIALDGQLSKAHLHLGGKTSCRAQAAALIECLEEARSSLGWRQSEAEALGAMWRSFRGKKAEVMKTLETLQCKARQEVVKECSVQAFQNRLRYLSQLEEELQSLHKSQQWLEEKGTQLAQKDTERTGEALRDLDVVKAALEYVKTLITKSQEQSQRALDLLRRYNHLRLILDALVEKARALAHNLPDHNHNAQEATRSFSLHEKLLGELREKQEDMDQLITAVEDLHRELARFPDCDASMVHRDVEALRAQWLEASNKKCPK